MAKKNEGTETPKKSKQTNPNSLKNLEKGDFSKRTASERRLLASEAGKASGRKRAAIKSFRESMLAICTGERKDKINQKVVQLAERGNLEAVKLTMQILGEAMNQPESNDNDEVREYINAVKAQKK